MVGPTRICAAEAYPFFLFVINIANCVNVTVIKTVYKYFSSLVSIVQSITSAGVIDWNTDIRFYFRSGFTQIRVRLFLFSAKPLD